MAKLGIQIYNLDESFFHLHPLALLVQKASKYKSTILICDMSQNNLPINAKKSLEVFSLIHHQNHFFRLEADGIDASSAINEISEFLSHIDDYLSLSLDNENPLIDFKDVSDIIETVSKKWTILIISELLFKNKVRYSELHKKFKNISPGILSNRLKELSKYEIIDRVQINSIPPEVYYSLTDKGFELVKILKNIKKWRKKWGFDEILLA